MAVLSKIREKTIVLIGIIGLALFAFVIQGVLKKSNSSKSNAIGKIDGEVISTEDFSKQLETYKARAGRKVTDIQAMNTIWDGIVRERVYKKQLEEAGIVVGEDDVWQAIIKNPYFQNDPSFKNEAGLFDEEKVKEFIANMREDAEGAAKGSREKSIWLNWLSNENIIKQNLIRSSYDNLVKAGLGASIAEGKSVYTNNNTNVTSQFVYVPYRSIADSLVKVETSDYKNYIKAHANEYQVDESRSLKLVKFEFKASEEDKASIKEELSSHVEQMKSTSDAVTFINEVKSDLSIDKNYIFKNKLPKQIAANFDAIKVGDVFGPYQDKEYYKLSKVTDIKKMPDSVTASHILISYVGLRSATKDTKQTEEEAKKTADSILNIVKRNTSKFAALAKEFSIDKSNADKGGKLDWFTYGAMVPEFRDYVFQNKKGDIGVVKTQFGYHIIKIDGQKNIQNAVQLATLARQIVPSEKTEGNYYQDAEIFASDLAKGKNFDELAKEKGYKPLMANKLKELGDNVPGLKGNHRQIVRWAFNNDNDVNAVNRFDVDNGYVVAMLYNKTAKGLATVADVAGQLRPIILKKKKAALIQKKMTATTLEEIAKENSVAVRTASKVTLESPTLSGVGKEPAVVGAMMSAKEGSVVKGIEGVRGVFAIKVISTKEPTELENYGTYRKQLANKVKGRSRQLFNALKEASDIEDYRATIY